MKAKFITEDGPNAGKELPLEEGSTWTLGRDSTSSNLVIEDPKVSRSHAQCTETEEGWTLENLSETNPIILNDTPIQEPILLKEGDRLKIGSYWYQFTYQDTEINEEPTLNQPTPKEENTPENPSSLEPPKNEEAPLPEEEPLPQEETPAPQTVTIHDAPEHLDDDAPQHTIFKEIDEQEEELEEQLHFDLEESSRWLIKVLSGPNSGAEFTLKENNSYTLGTDPLHSDIIFQDRSISRQHAKLTLSNNILTLEDLNSRNGTYIQENRLEGSSPLEANQVITMGTTAFIVIDRESASETIISPTPEQLPQLHTTPTPETAEESSSTEEKPQEESPEEEPLEEESLSQDETAPIEEESKEEKEPELLETAPLPPTKSTHLPFQLSL